MVRNNKKASAEADSLEHHQQRSEFIRNLVQGPDNQSSTDDEWHTPRTILQFWNDLETLPDDVGECIASWKQWESQGYEHLLFCTNSATDFIRQSLGTRHQRAFDRCYHPAMQADYFRMCYLLVKGGLYVDADDTCTSTDIDGLFRGSKLKVQPLCYDKDSDTMVGPSDFLKADAFDPNWIFYLNNNPLAACSGNPIIEIALHRATNILELMGGCTLPEIQSTTGPGNLSRSVFEFASSGGNIGDAIMILHDWESFAVSEWPLSYRNDSRNWRLSNRREFK